MKTNHFARVFLLVSLVLLSTQLFSENSFAIKGKIVNSDKQGVGSAAVSLFNSETMQIVGFDQCDEDGEFVIENLKTGNYVLSVNKPGFSKTDTLYVAINEEGRLIDNTISELIKRNINTKDSDIL